MRRQSFVFFVVVTLLSTFFVFTQLSSSAIISKEVYIFGEQVKINLRGIDNYRMKIQTPSTTYLKEGSNDVFSFRPDELGDYVVSVEHQGALDVHGFSVVSESSFVTETQQTSDVSFYHGDIALHHEFGEDQVVIDRAIKFTSVLEVNQSISDVALPSWAQNVSFYLLEDSRRIKLEANASALQLTDVVEVEYYAPGPVATENVLSEFHKEVVVSSLDELHYENVLAYTFLPEVLSTSQRDAVSVYWREEGEYLDFVVRDLDNDTLLDYVEWIVPHLSNQTFDVVIEVLNVKSFPIVGGEWTVDFTTIGVANLTIRAWNGTQWNDRWDFYDLQFLEVGCGTESFDYEWRNGSVFVADYSCNSTGYETSRVYTEGHHYLEFDFGGVKAYAENFATDPYDNLSQIYATTFDQAIELTPATIVNLSAETIVDTGFTHSPTNNPSRLYVNETDLYKISYACVFEDNDNAGNRAITEGFIRLNGATELIPSRTSCYTRDGETDRDRCSVEGVFIANLTDGDYIELLAQQLKQQATSVDSQTNSDCWLSAQRVRRPVAQIFDANGGDTYSATSDVIVTLDTTTYADPRAFTPDLSNNEIEIDAIAWYKVYYHVCIDNGPQGNRQSTDLYVRNLGAELPQSRVTSYYRNNAQGDINCNSGVLLRNFTESDGLDLRILKNLTESATTVTSTTLANQSWLLVEQIPTSDVLFVYEAGGGQVITNGATNAISFDTGYVVGDSYEYTSGSAISINETGLYEISYTFTWDDQAPGGNDRVVVCSFLRLDGTTTVQPSMQCDWSRGDAEARYASVSANTIVNISGNTTVELMANPTGRQIETMPNRVWISVVPLNVFIEQQGPLWLSVGANTTSPGAGDNVEFFAEWYHPLGLNDWEFFWDLGEGFVPAGSGSFVGMTNESSNITKQIPASMEGQVLEFFFRATNIDGLENQTATANVTVLDTTAPGIIDENVMPTSAFYQDFVALSANVTDTTGISSVWAAIYRPGGSLVNESMTLSGGDIYHVNYTNTLVGEYNATVFANDTNGFSGNGSGFLQWNVTGFANVTFITPSNGSVFDANSQVGLHCGVRDTNTSVALGNYPVSFYNEGSLIGINVTNITGSAQLTWTANGNGVVGLNCTIADNATLHYSAYADSDVIDIVIEVPDVVVNTVDHENLGHSSGTGWFNSAWGNRKALTIDSSLISEYLVEFPVLVELFDSDLRLRTQPDGDDIAFTSHDGQTQLSHEIELFNQTFNSTTSHLVAWVEVNISALTDTRIYLYYNNTLASNQEDPVGVWSSNFSAVWHMSETSALDSTGVNNATANNGVINLGGGTIDGANSFDGVDDYLCLDFPGTCPSGDSNPTFDDAFSERTISMWFRANNTNGVQILFEEGGATNGMNIYIDSGNVYAGAWCENCAPAWQGSWHGFAINANQWHHVVNNYDGNGNLEMYVDGVLINSTLSGNTMNSHTGDDAIGGMRQASKTHTGDLSGDGNYFNGTIDESRVSNIQRSSGWIVTSFRNQNDTQSFYSVGSQEENTASAALNEYEAKDTIDWINITVLNQGAANATDVSVILNLLYPNGTRTNWFTSSTLGCGLVAESAACQALFNNSGAGYNVSTVVSGNYLFNMSINWTGGGNSPHLNTSEVIIHYPPNNFTGVLTDSEIPREANTSYQFDITNPWSAPVEDVNVSIICPSVSGLACSCSSDPGSSSCFIGDMFAYGGATSFFNITTNASTPIGTYSVNVTLTYVNPGQESRTWRMFENRELIIRPLLAAIDSPPINVTRTNAMNLTGYAQNIGAETLSNVNLSWSLPLNWINTSGVLFNETVSLTSDGRFYGNITVSVPLNASLGNQSVVLATDSPNATQDTDTAIIAVYATTFVSEVVVNNSAPLRGDVISIRAQLAYDNGTSLVGGNVTFQGTSLSGLTNASGDTVVNFTVPSSAPLGANNYDINASYAGSQTLFTHGSFGNTTVSVDDLIVIVPFNAPDSVGFGYNVTLFANVTHDSLDQVFANVTFPNGSFALYAMDNTSMTEYFYNFSSTWQNGLYNYTIFANTTEGFSNETTQTESFSVAGNVSITVRTQFDSYIPNQIVNLTSALNLTGSANTRAEAATFTVTGTSNTDALTNAYNVSKAFIRTSHQYAATITDNEPEERFGITNFSSVSGDLTSEVTAQRFSSTDTMRSSYNIIQSDNIQVCSVQQDIASGVEQVNVSLDACWFNLPSNYQSKCFIEGYGNTAPTADFDQDCGSTTKVLMNITNTTNVAFEREAVPAGCTGTTAVRSQFYLVCFTDATTVTPINLPLTDVQSGATTVNIGHTVNQSNSWFTFTHMSTDDGIEQNSLEGWISSSSQVSFQRSSIGTTGGTVAAQGYVIEFPNNVGSSVETSVLPDADVGNGVIITSSFSREFDTNRSIAMCSYGFRSGEGTSHSRGEYPAFLLNSTTVQLDRGQTGNSDPSHDIACQAVQFPNVSITTINPSLLTNNGATDVNAYLLMTIESNSTGDWAFYDTVLNDTSTGTRRAIDSLNTLSLTEIWNGPGEGSGWDTATNPGGTYRARVALVDDRGQVLLNDTGGNISGNYEFEIDFNPPDVNLSFPENGTTHFGTSITVNYTATDPSGVANCSIFHDLSGSFTLEETKDYVNEGDNNFTISSFTENTLLRWNVRCTDTISNTGFTAEDRYFTMIVPPDFTLNDTDIVFNDPEGAIEGTNLTINATVYNVGGQSGNVTVQFFDGHPDNGTQIDRNKSAVIAAEGGTGLVQVEWTVTIGPHDIYVVLDPPLATNGTIIELNESNNLANTTIGINSWQEFYGNATVDKLLGNNQTQNITLWFNESSLSGNLFVADSESTIDFTSLLAIGRNLTGQNTTNDFTDIDTTLNTTLFFDSVANVFTSDGTTPLATTNFLVHQQLISGVPIVNSTNTTDFLTGILWDSSDDVADGEFSVDDNEDLVFTANVHKGQDGFYGTYDYEIRIPVRLREYNNADTQLVYLYFDLN